MSAALAVLTPSTMNYDSVGHGGMPSLTRAEMAGLLSGLSAAATNYALAKYCDDAGAFKLLQFHCIQVASGYAAKYDWKANKGKPCIISMGVLASIESVNPRLCFVHNSLSMCGNKQSKYDNYDIPYFLKRLFINNRCTCDNPRSNISHADRYRYIDIGRDYWSKVWRDRYEYMFNYCQMLDSQVGYCISNNC